MRLSKRRWKCTIILIDKMKTKEKPLSEKIKRFYDSSVQDNRFANYKDVKEAVSRAEERLKEALNYGCVHCIDGKRRIEKIFKEEFGEFK